MLEANQAGASVVRVHADETSCAEFTAAARAALDTTLPATAATGACVIVNYDMDKLATTTGSSVYRAGLPPAERVDSGLGHMSVLAAWHAETGRFLLLDTWPGTPSGWVSPEDMFNAMDTFDVTSKRKRGYVVLWR